MNFSSSLLACTRSAERDSVLVQTNGPISNDFTSVEYSDCIVLYMQLGILNWSKIIADWTFGLN